MEHTKNLAPGETFVGVFVAPSGVCFVEEVYKLMYDNSLSIRRFFILEGILEKPAHSLIFQTRITIENMLDPRGTLEDFPLNEVVVENRYLTCQCFIKDVTGSVFERLTAACCKEAEITLTDHADLSEEDLEYIEKERNRKFGTYYVTWKVPSSGSAIYSSCPFASLEEAKLHAKDVEGYEGITDVTVEFDGHGTS